VISDKIAFPNISGMNGEKQYQSYFVAFCK
jgi:hypothetical protein